MVGCAIGITYTDSVQRSQLYLDTKRQRSLNVVSIKAVWCLSIQIIIGVVNPGSNRTISATDSHEIIGIISNRVIIVIVILAISGTPVKGHMWPHGNRIMRNIGIPVLMGPLNISFFPTTYFSGKAYKEFSSRNIEMTGIKRQ